MTKIERKILSKADLWIPVIAVVFFSALKFYIASMEKPFVSEDMRSFLLPWFQQIKENGGILALSKQIGDYGILYQTIIAILTYIPLDPLYSIKLVSVAFDYLLGIAGGMLVWEISGRTKKALIPAAVAYCAVIISPITQMNSAVWGQCDSMYAFFCLMAVYFLWREKYIGSFIMLGIAFSLKLQTVFVLPVFIIWYLKTRKFSIVHFFLIPAMMITTSLPALILGRNVKDVFTVFANQSGEYQEIAMNSFTLGTLFSDNSVFYKRIAPVLISLCILFLLFVLLSVLKSKRLLSAEYLLEIAFISAFGCFLLLPSMHDRYGYLAEVLGILLAVKNRKTIPLLLPMLCMTAMAYGKFLFQTPVPDYRVFSIVNMFIFALYLIVLQIKSSDSDSDSGMLDAS